MGGDNMSTREESLAGAGGVRIWWQSWQPDGDPKAVVVIAHGAGEHSGRYEHVAARLTRERYVVYALDHRGHGRSDGARALLDRVDNAVADLDQLVVLAGGEHPGLPVFLIGHSMGGLISVSYAIAHQDRLAGLLLSGPLAALDAASPPVRMIAAVLSALTPKLGVIQVDATLVSRDPEVVNAYQSDPLVHHGKLPARTVNELAKKVGAFPTTVGKITIPTLIMHGTADQLAPLAGAKMLAGTISSTDKKLITYDGLYHEILNEPEQKQVMDDMCAWITAHIAVPAA
jgi:alpha-beta hydrolase superfamily lysophospholipase